MKGIILAGGSGTRLYPITKQVIKQLLPVYDKPMIYYPLSVFILAGIREILIISTPKDIDSFKKLFDDGSDLGLKLSYKVQPSPDGLAQAFILGEEFIGSDDVSLILGDNIFYGHGFTDILENTIKTVENRRKSVVFGYYVNEPERYGVIEFNKNREAISIEEKPENPKSNYAVTGLYFYTNDVVQIAKEVQPSDRGELEITSINEEYLKMEKLEVELLGRGFAWLDTGTHESLLEASNYIETIEKRQGLKVACIEEIAYEKGYISKEKLLELGNSMKKNQYGQYLIKRAEQNEN
jgi:glucose-1-phosphate thymidylyltransferase